MKKIFATFAISVCLVACAITDSANSTGPAWAAGDWPTFLQPIDYIPSALGPYDWKIATDSEEAQQYFKQGMQLRYAYNVDEAARSMAAARRIDPECAM